jgi:hypothetical protein
MDLTNYTKFIELEDKLNDQYIKILSITNKDELLLYLDFPIDYDEYKIRALEVIFDKNISKNYLKINYERLLSVLTHFETLDKTDIFKDHFAYVYGFKSEPLDLKRIKDIGQKKMIEYFDKLTHITKYLARKKAEPEALGDPETDRGAYDYGMFDRTALKWVWEIFDLMYDEKTKEYIPIYISMDKSNEHLNDEVEIASTNLRGEPIPSEIVDNEKFEKVYQAKLKAHLGTKEVFINDMLNKIDAIPFYIRNHHKIINAWRKFLTNKLKNKEMSTSICIKTELGVNKLKKLFNQLIEGKFINPDTKEYNFLHVFGEPLPDNENFEPVNWAEDKKPLRELLTPILGKITNQHIRDIEKLFTDEERKPFKMNKKESTWSKRIKDVDKIINSLHL